MEKDPYEYFFCGDNVPVSGGLDLIPHGFYRYKDHIYNSYRDRCKADYWRCKDTAKVEVETLDLIKLKDKLVDTKEYFFCEENIPDIEKSEQTNFFKHHGMWIEVPFNNVNDISVYFKFPEGGTMNINWSIPPSVWVRYYKLYLLDGSVIYLE